MKHPTRRAVRPNARVLPVSGSDSLPTRSEPFTLVLEGYRVPSWNQKMTGFDRQIATEIAAGYVMAALVKSGGRCFVERVRIEATAYYSSRLVDPDNCRVKPAIDALVRAQVLPDDRPEFVESVTLRSREGPTRLEIRIIPVEGER
jgi:Holliday junction resolvase RusA-like endonuclease